MLGSRVLVNRWSTSEQWNLCSLGGLLGAMTFRVVTVVALLGVLVSAPTADAAMCIRLSSKPERPVLGHASVVQIKTFYPIADGGLEPWIVRGYPFRVEAVSPRGRILRIKVKRSSDPYAWRGTLRFNAVGVWTIRVTNFGPSYTAGCGELLRVRVRAG